MFSLNLFFSSIRHKCWLFIIQLRKDQCSILIPKVKTFS
ncbi:cytochrome bd ubiquinol oxidase, subunit I [Lactococcus lactis subsp. lactis IO-1]|nr:cytochrome bd ubiquinol oxidase, subunit I [Lactococcus lactis subsp. lactis IO-1]